MSLPSKSDPQSPKNHSFPETVGLFAATLSGVEIGLGSLLHAFHLPLSGQFLSLNQSFFLTRAIRNSRSIDRGKFLPVGISSISALLKSLAPMGKKLTPMLAISAQGVLFNLGTVLLGANPVGTLLGSLLLALWAYLQPLLLYYFIFGKSLLEVGDYYLRKLGRVVDVDQETFLWVLVGFVGIKLVLAIVVWFLGWHLSDDVFHRYEVRLLSLARYRSKPDQKVAAGSQWVMALKDMIHPVFLGALLLTFSFFCFVEGDKVKALWWVSRSLIIAFLIFWVIRAFPVESLVARLKKRRNSDLAEALESAVRKLKS